MIAYGFTLRRIARRFPGFTVASGAVVLVAWCSAVYPLGVRARAQSPGLAGGLWLGVGAALIAAIPASLGMAIAGVGGDEDSGLSGVHRQLGVPDRLRVVMWVVVAVSLLADWVVLGAASGALVGLGRGLAANGALIGVAHAVSARTAALIVAAAAYAALLGAAAATRGGGRTEAAIVCGAGSLAFFGLLGVFPPESAVRWLLRVTPIGPLWSLALPPGHSALVLSMSASARAAVLAGWTVLAVLTIARGPRSRRRLLIGRRLGSN